MNRSGPANALSGSRDPMIVTGIILFALAAFAFQSAAFNSYHGIIVARAGPTPFGLRLPSVIAALVTTFLVVRLVFKVHGIGRLDLVENRFVGMKSRGMYETPGGTILHLAHRGIEQITLDRGAAHLKDELAPKYAQAIYNGFWFSPEREMLQAAIDHSQAKVSGTVRLKLYKGSVSVVGRKSPNSLYSAGIVTFEDDAGAYDQRDAAGFIKLNALRLRLLGRRGR